MLGRLWQGRRIPLAWLLLTRQPVRLLVALAGIAFAGIISFYIAFEQFIVMILHCIFT